MSGFRLRALSVEAGHEFWATQKIRCALHAQVGWWQNACVRGVRHG